MLPPPQIDGRLSTYSADASRFGSRSLVDLSITTARLAPLLPTSAARGNGDYSDEDAKKKLGPISSPRRLRRKRTAGSPLRIESTDALYLSPSDASPRSAGAVLERSARSTTDLSVLAKANTVSRYRNDDTSTLHSASSIYGSRSHSTSSLAPDSPPRVYGKRTNHKSRSKSPRGTVASEKSLYFPGSTTSSEVIDEEGEVPPVPEIPIDLLTIEHLRPEVKRELIERRDFSSFEPVSKEGLRRPELDLTSPIRRNVDRPDNSKRISDKDTTPSIYSQPSYGELETTWRNSLASIRSQAEGDSESYEASVTQKLLEEGQRLSDSVSNIVRVSRYLSRPATYQHKIDKTRETVTFLQEAFGDQQEMTKGSPTEEQMSRLARVGSDLCLVAQKLSATNSLNYFDPPPQDDGPKPLPPLPAKRRTESQSPMPLRSPRAARLYTQALSSIKRLSSHGRPRADSNCSTSSDSTQCSLDTEVSESGSLSSATSIEDEKEEAEFESESVDSSDDSETKKLKPCCTAVGTEYCSLSCPRYADINPVSLDTEEGPAEEVPDHLRIDLYFKKGEPVAGSLRGIVRFVCSQHALIDPTFVDMVLLCFRLWGTSYEFFDYVMDLFASDFPSDELSYAAKLRVMRLLKIWTHLFWKDEDDRPVLHNLYAFVRFRLCVDVPGYVSAALLQRVEHLMSSTNTLPVKRSQRRCEPFTAAQPSSEECTFLPREIWVSKRRAKHGRNELYIRDFLDKPGDLAEQLTLMETGMLRGIEPEDILRVYFSKDEEDPIRQDTADKLTRHAKLSDAIMRWAATAIMSNGVPEQRIAVYKFFIDVAMCCISLRNFSTANSLYTALTGFGMYELFKPDNLKSKDSSYKFAILKRFFQSSEPWKTSNYLLTSGGPLVPLMGIYRQRLVQLSETGKPLAPRERYSHGQTGNVINLNFWRTAYTKTVEQEIALRPYDIHPYPELQQYLSESLNKSWDSEQIRDLVNSYRNDKRQAEDQKEPKFAAKAEKAFSALTMRLFPKTDKHLQPLKARFGAI